MSDIVINKLCKSFGKKNVISDLSLILPYGKITCIMAPSGQGKTTLLRIIAGLESKDSGEISGVPEKISYVFQEDRLCDDFSAIGNIKFIVGNDFNEDLIKKHLSELDLGENMNLPVNKLSGGMKRRVAIARAMCYDYDLLLLDEPFKGLDVETKTDVMNYVKKYIKNKTVIMVTHDRKEVEFFGCEPITLKRLKKWETN